MLVVNLNEQAKIIQVKCNDEMNSNIVAEGAYAVDRPDLTVLVTFKHVAIAPDNHEQLGQLLSLVISTLGELYKSLVCLRLPTVFDNQIDIDKLEVKNKISWFMSVKNDNVKFYPDNHLKPEQEQYELITDKQLILNHSETLVTMMIREGFWCRPWDLEEMKNRINSATDIAMILDKINSSPCGFGRLFTLKTNDKIFGYASDIVVDSSHQSKGFGRIIINYLVGKSVNNNEKQQNHDVTLCLQCANEGTGAVSAPKLYSRSGFEYIGDIGNRIAIFANNEYYSRT
ncbi:unnamed protein product [Rotaria magnacalcarata]|uniref:N-acetyltransferase domain-containing protein n=1 Tax=Rotaria magnacalcarata TaxID=392030 RepID=A0A819C8L5_9BILA|nr:unnamed protein product [Rotaria magnacalcarata]CAF3815277.1 unnamed protein product [Rotaria magnacalcarata]